MWCRSCELRAASCKLQSHKKVEPRTCGVHPASCELRAASLRAAEKSSLGPVQNDAWQQLQCVGGGLPSLLGSGAEERGQAIAKLRRRRAPLLPLPRGGGILFGSGRGPIPRTESEHLPWLACRGPPEAGIYPPGQASEAARARHISIRCTCRNPSQTTFADVHLQ